MIGRVDAFRALLGAALPEMAKTFELFERLPASEQLAPQIYDSLVTADFSRDVVAPQSQRVGVVRLPNVGWTDLGQPARVRTLMNRYVPSSPALLSAAS